MGTSVSVIATAVSAIATVVIAIYAYQSHKLMNEIRIRNEEYEKKTCDLYKAIVIATIIGAGASSVSGNISRQKNAFHEFYDGETQIFKKK